MNTIKKLFTDLLTDLFTGSKKAFLSLVILTVHISLFTAQAATNVWDGDHTGSNSDLWSAKQNWVGNNGPPTAVDTASFGALASGNSSTPIITTASVVSNIVFGPTGPAYTLGGPSVLTVGGSIVNNSTLLQTINTALSLPNTSTINASSGSLAFGGIISGAGSLNKIGNGTATLSGANTFSGGVVVNGGTLSINNTTGSATGGGNVTVNSGSIIGTGISIGTLTLNSTTRISPGNASGPQRISTLRTGNQIWQGGSGMTWEINDATGTAGSGWDSIAITGGLTLNAIAGNQFTIDLFSLSGNSPGNAANFNPVIGYQWTILTTTTGISGFDTAAFNINTSGFSNSFTGTFLIELVNGGNGLAITYVPEPSTIALGIIGAAAMVGLSFRRRNKK